MPEDATNLFGPDGPYASPAVAAREELSWRRFMWSGLSIVILSAAVGTVLGAGCGFLLATIVPQYYQAMFSADFDPWQLGLGLGITQGAARGLASEWQSSASRPGFAAELFVNSAPISTARIRAI